MLKLLVFCGLLGGVFGRAEANPARPNVLFIAVDDLNHWDPYGWTNLVRVVGADTRARIELLNLLPKENKPPASSVKPTAGQL